MSAVEERVPVWPPRVDGEWSVEDLLHSPDDGQRYEILDGVLLVSPAPRVPHQILLDRVCSSDHQLLVDPADLSVQVYDLVDGEYRLVAQGGTQDTVTVDGPLPVSFDPAVLVG